MVVRQRGGDRGFNLDPAFGLSGELFDHAAGSGRHVWKKAGLSCIGYTLRCVAAALLLKIIGSSLTGN